MRKLTFLILAVLFISATSKKKPDRPLKPDKPKKPNDQKKKLKKIIIIIKNKFFLNFFNIRF